MQTDAESTVTEHLYKVLVIGDTEVGKTSLVRRLVKNQYAEGYKISVGADFALKIINWDRNTVVRLHLWDIAGQERVRNLSRVYYQKAMGALVVYDITNDTTLGSALSWKCDLDNKLRLSNGKPIPAVLLANKCDQSRHSPSESSLLDKICNEKDFVGWFETSAKENINVKEAVNFLVRHILLSDNLLPSEESHKDQIALNTQSEAPRNKTNCC
ncbi:ras-related protein Rab-32 [Chanos chanos]|uniref:Ras-related protein Rab n=1 Tax=Chanos chanos TaxID=29144 RepID=A0A6J2WJ50_CHACN|nr:ras-related protein Rab-32-like [Chanos chanos]